VINALVLLEAVIFPPLACWAAWFLPWLVFFSGVWCGGECQWVGGGVKLEETHPTQKNKKKHNS
jgi:hypothetical protein